MDYTKEDEEMTSRMETRKGSPERIIVRFRSGGSQQGRPTSRVTLVTCLLNESAILLERHTRQFFLPHGGKVGPEDKEFSQSLPGQRQIGN